MFVTRRVILVFIALVVCLSVATVTFYEDAHAALENSIHRAQDKWSSDGSTSALPNEIVAPDVIVRENATFYTLCQNKDLHSMLRAIGSVEEKFNSRFHYDWVFLNDEDFTSGFKREISEAVSGKAHFGKIPSKQWGYPDFIDQERAAETRARLKELNVAYGHLESYHHMCRFQAGFFYKHPLLQKYRYAWRVEPSISILCKQKTDPFRIMRLNEKVYGFNIAPMEIADSIPSLWNTTKEFLKEHEEYVSNDNLRDFISDDQGETYNLCHFWTNFEITDLDWLRGKQYEEYFKFLDKRGGFFYERWGDAPIRSIAASLFLSKDKIYFFNDIGYYHAPYGHCPYNQGPLELECDCSPDSGEFSDKYYDYHKNSCMRKYFMAKGRTWQDQNPGLSG